ncbi:hypothetical protein [Oscillibacter sp. CU971]|uniref:hypothetical protein n=1 Tax=Oscillibacter sp. CU971 TaxID=2780102 RepID=UPI001956CD55
MRTAKETDLPELLASLGYTVKRIGSYYTTKEMDILPSGRTQPKIKICRPAEIGLGDFGCSPWAQSRLAVKGWSGRESRRNLQALRSGKQKIFQALRDLENFCGP